MTQRHSSTLRAPPLPSDVQLTTPRIILGDEDKQNTFVNVVKVINTTTGSICTGTVISKTWVLTASHCFFGSRSATPSNPSEIVIEISTYDDKEKEFKSFFMKVKEVIVHDDFQSLERNDIALLHLERAVPKSIKPAAFFLGDLNNLIKTSGRDGLDAIAVGYGLTTGYNQIRITRAVREVGHVRLTSANTDTKLLVTRSYSNRNQIACSGDSGGPLFISVNNELYLVGVVGWGDRCRSNATYTYVAPYTEPGEMIRHFVPVIITDSGALSIDQGNHDEYLRIENDTIESTESEISTLGIAPRIGLGAIVFAGLLAFRNTFVSED